MGILEAQCDICHIIDDTVEFDNNSGMYHCKKCHLKKELEYLENYYQTQMRWLKNTHISQLKKQRIEIKKLRKKLKELD